MSKSRGELQMEPPAAEIEGEDYLQKLPKDLLVSIFIKLLVNSSISDLKFLFRCSLVSKRFNSIISTTVSSIQTLYLTNNIIDDDAAAVPKIKKKILKTIITRKFHNLRSFYLEFNELKSDLKWKAVYRSGIYAFVALRPKSESEAEWDSELESESEAEWDSESEPDGVLRHSRRISAMIKFHELMVLSIRKHKMLNNFVIADSKKQGKICFGDKLLKELRNDWKYNSEAFRLPAYVQSGVVPELRVLLFCSSPKPVEFLIIKIGKKARHIYSRGDRYIHENRCIWNCGLDDNGDIMNWDFDEEEKEFGEALTMILRDQKDEMWVSKLDYLVG